MTAVIRDEIFPPKNTIAVTCSYHAARSLVPPFRSHPSRSFFSCLLCFLLTFCVSYFIIFSVICYKAFCLHVTTGFCCIPVFCTKLEFYLVLLQSLCLFYNLYNCILLFSHIFHLCCCYSFCVFCFNAPVFPTVQRSWNG